MPVSSKWVVSKVEGQSVSLFPVCRGIENREWASATPGGTMQMHITNQSALDQFVVGEEYEAVFTHRPKPAVGDGHPVEVVEQFQWNPKTGANDKVYYVCGTCGSYASLNDDGTPNWSKHDEHFGG